MTWDFRPASSVTDQHGLFVALIGGTNSGKSWSAMRLARGIAGPKGKIAALDTEGGRLLHLKEHFDFDIMVMGPPHRPEEYFQAAKAAQGKGYDVLLIDSFTQEWRGIGGVLDWMDEEANQMVETRRQRAAEKGWRFDEASERQKVKMASSIKPKMAHKLMVNGILGLRIPIIFSIRGEMSLDPDTKKEVFKAQCSKQFPFELTVSFRLAADRKGVIDLSDPTTWKMERAHEAIFRDGDLLCEEHGAKLIAWARGGSGVIANDDPPPPPADPALIWAEARIEQFASVRDQAEFNDIMGSAVFSKNMIGLQTNRPELHAQVDAARAKALSRISAEAA